MIIRFFTEVDSGIKYYDKKFILNIDELHHCASRRPKRGRQPLWTRQVESKSSSYHRCFRVMLTAMRFISVILGVDRTKADYFLGRPWLTLEGRRTCACCKDQSCHYMSLTERPCGTITAKKMWTNLKKHLHNFSFVLIQGAPK